MDIESLLRRATAAPLGPLTLRYAPAGPDAWTLSVALAGDESSVRVEPEPNTDGLVLVRHVAGDGAAPGPSVTRTHPWVVESRAIAEGLELRLWLHGDGLSSAMLINAVVDLTQFDAGRGVDSGPVAADTEAPIPIPVDEAPRPEPVPVSPHRGISWQSFGLGRGPDSGAAAPSATGESPARAESLAPEANTPAPGVGSQSEPAAEPAQPVTDVGEPVPPEPPATAAPATQPLATTDQSSRTPAPGQKPGYCRECGSPRAADHVFCTNCGARLD
jgi:hypothetical protein